MVSNALDEIPPEFESEWENVAVTVSTGYATDGEKNGGAEEPANSRALLWRCPHTRSQCRPLNSCHCALSTSTRIVLWLGQRKIAAGNTPSGAPRISASSWHVTSEDERDWSLNGPKPKCIPHFTHRHRAPANRQQLREISNRPRTHL